MDRMVYFVQRRVPEEPWRLFINLKPNHSSLSHLDVKMG
jgi:hypothetical protein